MSLKPADIDYIIQLLTQITEALNKADSPLNKPHTVSKQKVAMDIAKASCRPYDKKEYDRLRKEQRCNDNVLTAAQQEYIESAIKPLRTKLDLYLSPRWPEILQLCTRERFSQKLVESFINTNIGISASSLNTRKEEIVNELERIKAKLKQQARTDPNNGKAGGNKDCKELSKPMSKSTMMTALGIDGYKKFNSFARKHHIQQAGNRQLWQICLDDMDDNTRQKLEKV